MPASFGGQEYRTVLPVRLRLRRNKHPGIRRMIRVSARFSQHQLAVQRKIYAAGLLFLVGYANQAKLGVFIRCDADALLHIRLIRKIRIFRFTRRKLAFYRDKQLAVEIENDAVWRFVFAPHGNTNLSKSGIASAQAVQYDAVFAV